MALQILAARQYGLSYHCEIPLSCFVEGSVSTIEVLFQWYCACGWLPAHVGFLFHKPSGHNTARQWLFSATCCCLHLLLFCIYYICQRHPENAHVPCACVHAAAKTTTSPAISTTISNAAGAAAAIDLLGDLDVAPPASAAATTTSAPAAAADGWDAFTAASAAATAATGDDWTAFTATGTTAAKVRLLMRYDTAALC